MIQIVQRPYLYNFSGNTIYYKLFSSEALADASIFFEVRIKFRVVDRPEFETVATMPFTPVDGVVLFDLAAILDAQLVYKMPKIFGDSTVTSNPLQSGFFYIEYREIKTTDPSPAWNGQESEYAPLVFKGGLHPFTYEGNNFFASYYLSTKPFLTWQPSGRKAARNERMYLCWINIFSSDPGSLHFTARVVYSDLTTSQVSYPIQGEMNQVLCLPAGCQQLDLESLFPAKTIFYWELTVMDNRESPAVALSQIFRIYLDNRHTYNDISFHYRNSLGGLDSVRVMGTVEKSSEYD